MAESLGSVPILSWDFYKHNRADVFSIAEYRLQMDSEIRHTPRTHS